MIFALHPWKSWIGILEFYQWPHGYLMHIWLIRIGLYSASRIPRVTKLLILCYSFSTSNNSVISNYFKYFEYTTEVHLNGVHGFLRSGSFAKLVAVFSFRRRLDYYISSVYVPEVILVVLSWCTFFITPSAVPARISLSITTILTTILLSSTLNSNIPKVKRTEIAYSGLLFNRVLTHAHRDVDFYQQCQVCLLLAREKNDSSQKDMHKTFLWQSYIFK